MTKISELSAAATLTGAETVPVVQSGSTVRTTVTDLLAAAPAVPVVVSDDLLKVSNTGLGLDAALRSLVDGNGVDVPLRLSTSAVMLPEGAVWPYGDSTRHAGGQTGIIVPFYIYPNNPYTDPVVARLLGLIRQYRDVPVIVVINPSSGPGAVWDGNYAAFIRVLKAAGALVAGYVSTAYAVRSEGAVQADINAWLTLYADTPISTIFMDEQPYDLTVGAVDTVALYARYTDYCHARNLFPVIGNPGTNQRGEHFATRTADIIVVNEVGTYPTEAAMLGNFVGGHVDYRYTLRAAMVYAQATLVPGLVRQLAKYVQYVYVTDDVLSPSPWDSLPTYLEHLFAILAGRDGVSVLDRGAVGDGTVDDTAAIQAALTASRNVTIPAGTYSATNLTMVAGTRLTLEAGATLKRRAAATGVLLTIGNDCVVTGSGTIDGNGSVVVADLDTLKSNGTSRITVEGIRLSNTCGVGWAWNINVGDHLVLRSCRIDSSNYGVRVWKGRYVTIDDNTFANVIYSSVRGDGDAVRYGKALVISNNRLRSSGGFAVLCAVMSPWPGAVDDGSGLVFRATAPSSQPSNDYYDHNQPWYVGVDVIDNTFLSCPTYGITVRAEQVVISRNVIDGCSYSGIVPQARQVVVTDNTIKNCASVGIDLGNCAWLTCSGNVIDDCDDIGIEVTCVNYGTITNNVVRNSGLNTNAPIRVGNGSAYSNFGTAIGCIIAHNTVVCIAANVAGIYCSSSVNTLLSYTVTDNIVIDASAPAVGYVPVYVGGGLTTFNLLVGIMASTTTGRTWFGADEPTAALSINPGTANVNGFRIDGSNTTGGVVALVARGTDTNIDLRLAPQGSGVVRFGSLTASADAAVSGYIVVKDSGGTTRKLAVIT